ncbi:interferon-inducible GTPase 5-like protein [Labeo rohita]|uniref:Interferon-inducible GTPase 5-like protein n=1 Tax=Labeo rohita TaxID=84645 RepID=A0A498NWM0_LABRO|nr:interferon-inducible GTPase 5-like protein [Labeo rohita]
MLLPCGYLPVEENTEPVQKSVPRRPGTRATPAVEEENSSEEEDDALTSLWLSSPVPVVSESPIHPDLSMTDVPDTQHAEPPSSCSVEGPVQSQNDNPQNFDNPPEHDTKPDFDLPDMFQSIPDSPLIIELTSHQSDTEYIRTDEDTPAEQANEPTLIQNHSPADDHSDARREQLAVPSAISDTDEENDGLKRAEPEDGKDETMNTEENTDTNDPVRKSERIRQPPRRLDYTELGSPLITAVKSFFQGLSTALAGDMSEEPVQSPTPSLRIIVI